MASHLVDIAKIGPGGLDVSHRSAALAPREGEESLLLVRAGLSGRIERSPRGARLEARLEAVVRVSCGRCLEPVDVPVDERVRLEILLRVPPAPATGEVRVEADDTRDFPATEGKVDLDEIVTEQIWLHLPLRSLCAEACLGLCPACGENRNRLECDCVTAAPDPRLAPLADLKRRLDGS